MNTLSALVADICGWVKLGYISDKMSALCSDVFLPGICAKTEALD